MLKALHYFWKEQPVALSAFVLAIALLVFFGGRFVFGFIYFHDPAHRNQALEPWMTPRYVSLSYAIPPEIVQDVMELEDMGRPRVKLDEVTAKLGISLAELQERVWAAKKSHMEEKRTNAPKKLGNGKRQGAMQADEPNQPNGINDPKAQKVEKP
ncbi:hypothetical protein [Cohaesibacter celericrescens]|uniref:Uncharacterized protein n=1 Tax=Cohaesibacter celericrescens TaxID=2067669 RepID=A0A2N5XK72_9HYPH|nr:hypothetical protein [Cohaesibacter celericrescens]PLW74902.1 hypothetical protein C0081_21560 [Cohaesibacter celericrescens]